MSLSFFAPQFGLLIRLAESYDLDVTAMLTEVEIDPATVCDYNARIPQDKVFSFCQKLAEIAPNPNFGLSAGQYYTGTQHKWGHSVMHG